MNRNVGGVGRGTASLPRSAPRRATLIGLLLLAGSAGLTTAAESPRPLAAARRFEWEFATGILWNVGGGATPLSYVVTPQILSLRISPGIHRPWAGGMLSLRPRFSLLIEPIVHGPERHYVGASAAGDLEWRTASGRFAAFFASGGGAGAMDSRGHEIRGAQGQDFNFNWLIHSGVRVRTRRSWEGSLGLYFQHVSNGGRDRVNPGLNALGPVIGVGRRF